MSIVISLFGFMSCLSDGKDFCTVIRSRQNNKNLEVWYLPNPNVYMCCWNRFTEKTWYTDSSDDEWDAPTQVAVNRNTIVFPHTETLDLCFTYLKDLLEIWESKEFVLHKMQNINLLLLNASPHNPLCEVSLAMLQKLFDQNITFEWNFYMNLNPNKSDNGYLPALITDSFEVVCRNSHFLWVDSKSSNMLVISFDQMTAKVADSPYSRDSKYFTQGFLFGLISEIRSITRPRVIMCSTKFITRFNGEYANFDAFPKSVFEQIRTEFVWK